jgi:precorrin-2 dehydrogenase/sirohydrochlorin ferrochelatase
MSNELFPVFMKMDKLQLLVVGAGEVGFEKIGFMFRHCSNAFLKVIAPEVNPAILKISEMHPSQFKIINKKFEPSDFEGVDLAIAATADPRLNKQVWEEAKKHKVLINVADTPDLCDFYLSSVVKKGDLKIAISSNGKSPTLTKRMRELLTDVLPEEIDDLLQNLAEIRDNLKGDFEYKVDKLNEITNTFKER